MILIIHSYYYHNSVNFLKLTVKHSVIQKRRNRYHLLLIIKMQSRKYSISVDSIIPIRKKGIIKQMYLLNETMMSLLMDMKIVRIQKITHRHPKGKETLQLISLSGKVMIFSEINMNNNMTQLLYLNKLLKMVNKVTLNNHNNNSINLSIRNNSNLELENHQSNNR